MRALAGIALMVAAFFFLLGTLDARKFSHDAYSYAENSCPAPSNGVDTPAYRDCLDRYRTMTPLDVAGAALLKGGLLLLLATACWILGQDPSNKSNPPEHVMNPRGRF
jgi:hypothetical protein